MQPLHAIQRNGQKAGSRLTPTGASFAAEIRERLDIDRRDARFSFQHSHFPGRRSAVSSLGGFRTTATVQAVSSGRPSSETLHKFRSGCGHSITASAIIRIDTGRARPGPLAVFDCQPVLRRLLVHEAALWAHRLNPHARRETRQTIVSTELW